MKTAMILAAGRGERLKPLTDTCPKALCTVNDTPLIEYHVTKLAKAGFKKVVINHAYLGGKIRQLLGTGARFGVHIEYAPEPPGGLETGGGIVNALPLLGTDPFLVINADIFTDFSFETCLLPDSSLAHLILVPPPVEYALGDFSLSTSGKIDNDNKEYTFSGIASYHPDLFQSCLPGRFSLTPLLRQLAHDHLATGSVYTGLWFDIGAFSRLQEARLAALSSLG